MKRLRTSRLQRCVLGKAMAGLQPIVISGPFRIRVVIGDPSRIVFTRLCLSGHPI